MTNQVRHLTIRCDSRPWANRSIWATIAEACSIAHTISEEAYEDDVERYGDSRVHQVYVMRHSDNTIIESVAFTG